MVSYDIRKLQLVQLEILKDIDKICKENNIQYYIFYGTLLGAIRHEGFIPWDDDIDIGMLHNDFVKFNKLCEEKLPEKYFLQNEKTDKNFPRMWSKIRINNTCNMEREYRRLKVHYGIDMDVFDIIYLSDNLVFRKIQKACAYIYRLLMFEKAHNAIDDEFKRSRDTKIYKILPGFLKSWLLKLSKKITYCTAIKKSNYVMDVSEILIMDSDIFEKTKMLKFEGEEFFAPYKSEKFLEEYYGDYMTLPPENERNGHGDRIVDFENSYEKYTL
ncbi:phosphorylcholine transferase LicD [Clostridium paraputrificum]|uniref:phosphorylcholine transferase LicD n=1 Tax=Clostridium paraputrificum TaxID=29363 RepID=UPI0034A3DFF0